MKRGVVVLMFFLVMSLFPTFLQAQVELYDEPGLSPYRETIGSAEFEHIDPFTGGLTISHIDIRLPGNGGLDLVIQRTFNPRMSAGNGQRWVIMTGNARAVEKELFLSGK